MQNSQNTLFSDRRNFSHTWNVLVFASESEPYRAGELDFQETMQFRTNIGHSVWQKPEKSCFFVVFEQHRMLDRLRCRVTFLQTVHHMPIYISLGKTHKWIDFLRHDNRKRRAIKRRFSSFFEMRLFSCVWLQFTSNPGMNRGDRHLGHGKMGI